MPPVLISCPQTSGLVPTGAQAKDAKDLENLPDENVLLACPECGSDHAWTPLDAVVAPGA